MASWLLVFWKIMWNEFCPGCMRGTGILLLASHLDVHMGESTGLQEPMILAGGYLLVSPVSE